MSLNRTVVCNLVEAAEAVGITSEALAAPVGVDLPAILSGAQRIEWRTFTEVLDHLASMLGHDPDRLREVGRKMTHRPSYAVVRRFVRGAVSVPMLYRVSDRWLTSSNFPFLRVFMRFETSERMQMHLEIPPHHAPSEPLFWISAGAIETLPELVDLPRAVLLESRVSPRIADFDLKLPRMSALRRVRGLTRTLASFRTARSALDEHRRELSVHVEDLARARAELKSILDRVPNLVLVHVRGQIVWVNRPWLTALGYKDVSEVVGMSVLDTVAPRSRARVQDRLGRNVVGSLDELVLVSRTGEEIVVDAAPAQNVVFEGTPARIVVARDVTERVMMQQRLLVADRMAAVGLLAAGVAHEVNNPLAYILNNIEIARKRLAGLGAAGELAREPLAVALEGVDRIRTVVRDLLMLARGEGCSETLVDVRAVAESTIALARPDIHGVADLVVDFSPVPVVQATEARIAQILLNLIGNALEAMRGLPREQCKLVVRIARETDGRVLLELSDSGRGIAAFDVARVFEPFFTTKPAGEGTGLGLPIVQRLVMELGGEITVSSTLGQGASFRVLLPPAASSTDAMRPTGCAGASDDVSDLGQP